MVAKSLTTAAGCRPIATAIATGVAPGYFRRMSHDAVDLTARLIRCPSVTPAEGGALVLLETVLAAAGFECHRVDRGGVANLFARWGRAGHPKSFGFNGHTDVVPVGDAAAWSHDPFGGEIRDGWLWGRGATDMKSGVAAFVAAACDFVTDTPPDGAVIVTDHRRRRGRRPSTAPWHCSTGCASIRSGCRPVWWASRPAPRHSAR